jgi:competence protein ComGC
MRLAKESPNRGSVGVEWFAVLLIACVLVLLTTPTLRDADEAALRTKCK